MLENIWVRLRQCLIILFVGMNAVIIGGLITGCTSTLISPIDALPQDDKQLYQVAGSSQEFNKERVKGYRKALIKTAKQMIKELKAKNLHRVQKLLEEFQTIELQVVNYLASVGVWDISDQYWANQIVSRDISLPTLSIRKDIEKVSKKILLTQDMKDYWITSYRWDNDVLLQEIRDKGIEELWKEHILGLARLSALLDQVTQDQLFILGNVAPECPVCPWILRLIVRQVVRGIVACAMGEGLCQPEPVPPPPPPPPTGGGACSPGSPCLTPEDIIKLHASLH
jgi:hypothetical protein